MMAAPPYPHSAETLRLGPVSPSFGGRTTASPASKEEIERV
jgi:hypothetical protein